MATEVELAWAAGLFDGEGCIQIAKQTAGKNVNHTLVLSLAMVDTATVAAFQTIVRCGTIRKYANGKARPLYTWRIWNTEAVKVLQKLYPHLVTKVAQAQVGINFQRMKNANKGKRLTVETLEEREECKRRLTDLKYE